MSNPTPPPSAGTSALLRPGLAAGGSPTLPVPTADLLGLRFHRLTERECVEHVLARLRRGEGGWIVTPNLDIVRMVASSAEIRRLLGGADLWVADGMPIVWASRLIGDPLPER